MKTINLSLLALALLAGCMPRAAAQNIDQLPPILGAAVDSNADKVLLRDASVDAAAGGMRTLTLAELMKIPSLYGSGVAAALAKPAGSAGGIRREMSYVFEGDSILTPDWDSVNTPTMGFNTSVATQFLKYYDSNSGTLTNHAVSGQTLAQMVGQYVTQAKLQAPNTTGIRAWLVIHGGINDVAGGATAANIYADMKTLWAAARADGFLVCASTHHGWTTSPIFEVTRLALNNLILSDVNLYDAVARLDLALPGYRSDQYVDAVHGNEIGRKLLAQSIVAAIKGRSQGSLAYSSARTAASTVVLNPGSPYAVPLVARSDAGGNWLNSNSFKCRAKGKYLVCANILAIIGSMSAADTILGRIYVNDVAILRCSQYGGLSGTNIPLSLSGSGIVEANIADVISFKIETSGPTASIPTVPENCWMQVYQLPEGN